ncbi:MAG TPA: S-methyl-5-thioribose-1-phosphate isomerase [Deltaproteobacteria bacterium]|nr:MAG: S-methyl-5-thioribose-1-phosphate isomerase [Deltaproteobacteria bacterium CG06_land_8_20_14_3_00_44_19]PIZ20182.1 MAG: S-methyl-5-thioribose-1-phosphate isomerase [Deltaproteobacteria bacterium CG_4_10_14_0_8_um_filter_43_12]HCX89630.1 S-methyl-5-thioribose-1-phosphate isomerase [Deltaproteobacteria bacterium]
MTFKTIEWKGDAVLLIDQTRLPNEEVYIECRDHISIAKAIKDLKVRGAPAIGVTAAMGVALGAKGIETDDRKEFIAELKGICDVLSKTRPTAVNLFWAIDRMMTVARSYKGVDMDGLKELLEEEALAIYEDDICINHQIGVHGKVFIKDNDTILTHCNAGALATAGFGTALGVIRAAWEKNKNIRVFADETRPFLQGARLTAWELVKDKIPVTLITDNMAGYFMKKKMIDLVIVGADRIAANGDVANKIGTYTVAVLAKEHGIPFYVAAPLSTLDLTLKSGEEIPIEERDEREVTQIGGVTIAPKSVKVLNPAFDVTPNTLITAIITEKGIATKPFLDSLKKLKAGSK